MAMSRRGLIVAMEAEKRQQKKAAVGGTSTPRKPKAKPDPKVIGSSSTWKDDELELFRVSLRDVASPKEMIPEKWFDFSRLKGYQEGIHNSRFSSAGLMVGRDILLSMREQDVFDHQKIRRTEWFNFAFLNLRSLMTLKTTGTRRSRLAAKRREHKENKDEGANSEEEEVEVEEEEEEDNPLDSLPPLVSQFKARRVGPRASPEPETDAADPPRIPSIADPNVPSVDTNLYYSCRELTSQNLGNNFCTGALLFCFDQDPKAELQWVEGRNAFPILHWRDE